MGTMFPPDSTFVPSYGAFTGGAPVGGAMLQPYLTYPSRARLMMRYW
jgi:hypothetical protein